MERWVAIPGYEGRYEVSDLGRVRSLARDEPGFRHYRGRVLRPSITDGYPCVGLCKQGGARRVPVHTLVLTAFVGPRPPGFDAAHWDGVRTNNTQANLRWASRKENQADRVRHGTDPKGERGPAKLTWEAVDQIRSALAQGGTLGKTAAVFGVSKRTVLDIKTGRTWRKLATNAH